MYSIFSADDDFRADVQGIDFVFKLTEDHRHYLNSDYLRYPRNRASNSSRHRWQRNRITWIRILTRRARLRRSGYLSTKSPTKASRVRPRSTFRTIAAFIGDLVERYPDR